ncbi:50S ribosomal protein L9 [Peptoniphilus equinus]|uniref:Large ribosomal subunit protein bL9 n=1 Tax=Peptoniphilus equinus TaxID=3016343 RepID=A0ABY7QSU7_9FIRM|nr:50S ribosomal protein L9 [Peptoniphilus equinus]WBW49864.1 50S ribosomal protein L9 [Peptoniphilus equinus]
MKVILLKDDKNLGKKNDLVNAKDGYAKNFLIPKGIAMAATDENIEKWKADNAKREAEEAENVKHFTQVKATLEKSKVTITAKGGEGGRLFGAITSQNIADAIKDQLKLDIDKKKIELPENIKQAATKQVPVKLYPGITATLKVVVDTE